MDGCQEMRVGARSEVLPVWHRLVELSPKAMSAVLEERVWARSDKSSGLPPNPCCLQLQRMEVLNPEHDFARCNPRWLAAVRPFQKDVGVYTGVGLDMASAHPNPNATPSIYALKVNIEVCDLMLCVSSISAWVGRPPTPTCWCVCLAQMPGCYPVLIHAVCFRSAGCS